MSLIRSEMIDEGIVLITLNNPPLNLVTVELTALLNDQLDKLASDASVRVLILTGIGERAFCAGSDIREFSQFSGPDGQGLEGKLIAENDPIAK